MPRRASSGANVGMIAGVAAAIIGFLVIAILLFRLIAGDMIGMGEGERKGGNTSATALNLATYRDNGNSLRGNVYRVEGKVEETLRWTAERGRLISFEAEDGGMTIPVPVLVPEDLSSINIERGSNLAMVVRVDRDGTLVAESIE